MASLRFLDCGSIPALPPPPRAPRQTSVPTTAALGPQRDKKQGETEVKWGGGAKSHGREEIDWLTGMEKEVKSEMRKRIDFEGWIKEWGGGRCPHQ